MKVIKEPDGTYVRESEERSDHLKTATVFCKMPWDGRGMYSEEIDVRITKGTATEAKKVAAAAIAKDYDPELRPVKVIFRIGWFF